MKRFNVKVHSGVSCARLNLTHYDEEMGEIFYFASQYDT